MSKSYFLVKLRKFESASTVMYCILSSFIQENTQRLSVTIYTHYSLAVWLRSFTKWVMSKKKEEEERSNLTEKQHAWIQKGRFLKFWLALRWFHSAARRSPASPTIQRGGFRLYAIYHSEKFIFASTTEWNLLSSRKKDDNQKIM